MIPNVTSLSLDVLAISEPWRRRGVMDAKLTVAGYRLFRKDLSDGRKGGGVFIIVKDPIPPVPHTFLIFLLTMS